MSDAQSNGQPDFTTGSYRNIRTLSQSIGELVEYDNRDLPHFIALLVNTAVVGFCAYILLPYRSGDARARFAALPLAVLALFFTGKYDLVNIASLGGSLVALSQVLSEIYYLDNGLELVSRMFVTWFGISAILLALLLATTTQNFRRRIGRKRRQERLRREREQMVKKAF